MSLRMSLSNKVELSAQEFDALEEYSLSVPTGTTLGKRWKRRLYLQGQWIMGEYTQRIGDQAIITWSDIICPARIHSQRAEVRKELEVWLL